MLIFLKEKKRGPFSLNVKKNEIWLVNNLSILYNIYIYIISIFGQRFPFCIDYNRSDLKLSQTFCKLGRNISNWKRPPTFTSILARKKPKQWPDPCSTCARPVPDPCSTCAQHAPEKMGHVDWELVNL